MAQKKKVAVYVTSDEERVSSAETVVSGALISAIIQSDTYQAVERANDFMKQINEEQHYQHSGNVDNEQISELGKQFGADLVCVAKISSFDKTCHIQARIIDVETVTVLSIAQEFCTMSNTEELINAANKIANTMFSTNESSKPAFDEGLVVHHNGYVERHSLGEKEYVYGTTQMNKKEYADFLKNNCRNAFLKYYKGNQMITAGWVLVGLGCAMTVTGWTIFGYSSKIADARYPNYQSFYRGEYYYGQTPSEINQYMNDRDKCRNACEVAGSTIGYIGVGSIGTSIIILPIGYVYRNKAMKIYNEQCAYKHTASCTFNLQSSRDGIGIALTF